MPLIFTLGTGIFMILGMIIVLLTKNNRKFVDFSISIAFSVMIMLIFGELLPEAIEEMSETYIFPKNILFVTIFVIIGILLLKILDLFIPDHNVDEKNTSELENLFHIGIVSSVALILHNIIEGMAIYSAVTKNPQIGFLVTIGVGLHNIPMGMVITSTLYQSNQNKKKTIFLVLLISLSTFLGGGIMHLFAKNISEIILGILLSITLGMLFYIVVFELFEEIKHNHDKKTTYTGIIIGILLFLITLFLE